MRKILLLTVFAIGLATSTYADGIQTIFSEEDDFCKKVIPRDEYEATIEGDPTGLYNLYLLLLEETCGPDLVKGLKNPKLYKDWEHKFLPQDPLPSPVPLSGTFVFSLLGIMALVATSLKRKA